MGEPPTDADLAALLDEERSASAAKARSTQRWIRQQALEAARLTGVLLAAAEQHESVTLRTTSGRSYTGRVVAVGSDFAAITTHEGTVVYIALAALTLLQCDRGLEAVAAEDARPAPRAATLRDVLADHAADRTDVSFVCAGSSDSIPGQLVGVGVDVASIAVDERGRVAYVALSSVTEFLLRASG